MIRPSRAIASLAVVFLAAAAGAQNLLSNPDFDTDLVGWTTFAAWSSEDWEGSSSSGSVTLLNNLVSPGTDILARQCIELASLEAAYQLRGWLMSQAADGGAGDMKIGIAWYSQPACATFLEGIDTADVGADTGWNEVRVDLVPHVDTKSAEITAYIYKSVAAGTLAGYLDHAALLGPAIFSDGFESGDWFEWSLAVN